jgi:hypothetical protein
MDWVVVFMFRLIIKKKNLDIFCRSAVGCSDRGRADVVGVLRSDAGYATRLAPHEAFPLS